MYTQHTSNGQSQIKSQCQIADLWESIFKSFWGYSAPNSIAANSPVAMSIVHCDITYTTFHCQWPCISSGR